MDTTADQTLIGAHYAHGRSVGLPKAPGYTLTCINADGVMHMMQISKIQKALHPFISFLPAEQGHCKTSWEVGVVR